MGNSPRIKIIGVAALACVALAGCKHDKPSAGPSQTKSSSSAAASASVSSSRPTSTTPSATAAATPPPDVTPAPADPTPEAPPATAQTTAPAPVPPAAPTYAPPPAEATTAAPEPPPAPVTTEAPAPPPPALPAPYLMSDYNPLGQINAKRAANGWAPVVQGGSSAAASCALNDACGVTGLQWGGAGCSGGDLDPQAGSANSKSVVWAKAYRSDLNPVGCKEAIAFSSFG